MLTFPQRRFDVPHLGVVWNVYFNRVIVMYRLEVGKAWMKKLFFFESYQ